MAYRYPIGLLNVEHQILYKCNFVQCVNNLESSCSHLSKNEKVEGGGIDLEGREREQGEKKEGMSRKRREQGEEGREGNKGRKRRERGEKQEGTRGERGGNEGRRERRKEGGVRQEAMQHEKKEEVRGGINL